MKVVFKITPDVYGGFVATEEVHCIVIQANSLIELASNIDEALRLHFGEEKVEVAFAYAFREE